MFYVENDVIVLPARTGLLLKPMTADSSLCIIVCVFPRRVLLLYCYYDTCKGAFKTGVWQIEWRRQSTSGCVGGECTSGFVRNAAHQKAVYRISQFFSFKLAADLTTLEADKVFSPLFVVEINEPEND